MPPEWHYSVTSNKTQSFKKHAVKENPDCLSNLEAQVEHKAVPCLGISSMSSRRTWTKTPHTKAQRASLRNSFRGNDASHFTWTTHRILGDHMHLINKWLKEKNPNHLSIYNMKLNRRTCNDIWFFNFTANRRAPAIKYQDGTEVPRQNQLNDKTDNSAEVQNQILMAMKIFRQLKLLWEKASATTANGKLRAYNAITQSKLMFSLETTQLTQSELNKVGSFQLNRLRPQLSWASPKLIKLFY